MRLALALAIAFASGAVVSRFVAPIGSPRDLDQTTRTEDTESETALAYAEVIGRLQDERNRLANENAEFGNRIAALESELAEYQRGADEPDEPHEAAFDEASTDAETETTPSEAARQRRREEFESRRLEFAARIEEFMNQRFATIQDPEAIERLNAVLEWQEYQHDLRRQFRDAETDEEREAVRAEMEVARYNAESIVSTQQDDLIRDLAASFDIPESERQAFVDGMREVLADPFFEMEPVLTGGGFGPRGRRGSGRGGFGN